MKFPTWNIVQGFVGLGKGIRQIVLPAFFYIWGVFLAVRAVLFDKVVGWQSGERYLTEWLNQFFSQYGVGSSESLSRSEGYESLVSSSELLIPISLIVSIMFLVLAYKLTPKSQ